jgi:hypothetical protein
MGVAVSIFLRLGFRWLRSCLLRWLRFDLRGSLLIGLRRRGPLRLDTCFRSRPLFHPTLRRWTSLRRPLGGSLSRMPNRLRLTAWLLSRGRLPACSHSRKCSCSWYVRKVGCWGSICRRQGACRRQRLRAPVVYGGELRPIALSLAHVVHLLWHRGYPLLSQNCQFRRRGTDAETASPTVITNFNFSDVCDSIVVDVVNNCSVHVVHRSVVGERASVPIPSLIPAAPIAEPIIDATIEADVRPPVTVISMVSAARKRPVGRCPEGAHVGSDHRTTGSNG